MDYIKSHFRKTKKVSLARAISKLGVTSRKKAGQLIKEGVVTVNDKIIENINFKVDPDKDKISINGKVIKKVKPIYILLNKPEGYITTRSDELNRKTVYDLITDIKDWVFPVGRLDKDTSGLLILTNDNRLGELLTNPESEVPKTYSVFIDKPITEPALEALRKGVTILRNYKTLPAQVETVNQDPRRLILTICEGKNRQIRRMFEALNYKVLNLTRIKIGNLKIGDLKAGEWRYLTKSEIKELQEKL
ncbi:MAG: Ribosomal large subunit pseudouridine synthase B [Ignavibacteriae bacterium]|nr:MAG: Ribosomal large subunit pseudouridine synthase B [Ignavibacteriota bacterium]